MDTVAIIPARMGSSRFPGKPLASIQGLPMIRHVYSRTLMSRLTSEVYIATCDDEIYEATEDFGGKAIMTSDKHERPSERVAEAARSVDADIVVMVQGDEPMVRPSMIDDAVAPMLEDESIDCVNLAGVIRSENEFRSPHIVKVVVDDDFNALYFSREPIPSTARFDANGSYGLKQVCVIPFRRGALLNYAELTPTPLEQKESNNILRLL